MLSEIVSEIIALLLQDLPEALFTFCLFLAKIRYQAKPIIWIDH